MHTFCLKTIADQDGKSYSDHISIAMAIGIGISSAGDERWKGMMFVRALMLVLVKFFPSVKLGVDLQLVIRWYLGGMLLATYHARCLQRL